jgi:uncharacterized protein (UPF0333 family)
VKKMGLDNRGLASAELLFVMLIALIIMGGMVSLINSRMDNTQTGDLGVARIEGEKIASAINTAYKNGKGYSIDISFPDGENFVNFTANVTSDGYVTIIYPDKEPMKIKLTTTKIYTNYTLNSNSKYRIANNGSITITSI